MPLKTIQLDYTKAEELLNQHRPNGVQRINILNEATIHKGYSGATVWEVDIVSQGAFPGGLAIAKFDNYERCQREKSRTMDARNMPVIEQHSPKHLYASNVIELNVDGETYRIGFLLSNKARDDHAEGIATLETVLKENKRDRTVVVEQVRRITASIFETLYRPSLVESNNRETYDICTLFARLMNVDADEGTDRVGRLDERMQTYFGLQSPYIIFRSTTQKDATELPNPAYFLHRAELWQANKTIRAAEVPMHGDLHAGNIICQVKRNGARPLELAPRLIDFANYESGGVPFYDLAHLEFDLLSRYLPSDHRDSWREWEDLIPHLTGELCSETEPKGERSVLGWQLIRPIRLMVKEMVNAAGKRAADIDHQLQRMWWVAMVAVGMRAAQRENSSQGIRAVGLLYAAHALKQLDPIAHQGKVTTLEWQDDYGLRADAPPPNTAPPRPPIKFSRHNLYTPHRYEIKTTFVGRVDELARLDDWAQSSDTILQVVAIGGQGKSALTWEWFNTRAAEQIPNLVGGLWWSFYESDGAMSRFLENALRLLVRRSSKEIEAMSRQEREEALIAFCHENTILLVFDGLERILNAYRTETAATQTDDDVDVQTHDETPDMTDHPRACFNVQDAQLIRRLGETNAKILISTRLRLRELEDMMGKELSGVRVLTLKGLSDGDALRLMRHYDIQGNDVAIMDFARTFEGHGLLLRLIIGKIRKHSAARGDFDRWYEQEGRTLDLTTLDIRQKRTRVLEIAVKALSADAWALLRRLSVYNYAFDFDAVMMIHPFSERYYQAPVLPPAPFSADTADRKREDLRQAQTDYQQAPPSSIEEEEALEQQRKLEAALKSYDEWRIECARLERVARAAARPAGEPAVDTALDELEDRGLINYDYEQRTWDMHPVVRGEAYGALTTDRQGRDEALAGKRSYFERREKRARVSDVDDLRAEIEIYQAWLAEGAFDHAAHFYEANLGSPLEYQLNAYHEMIRLLRPLFRNGLDQPPALRDHYTQTVYINDLANAYRFIDSSQELQLRALNIHLELIKRGAQNLGVDLANWSETWESQGYYASTIHILGLALRLAQAAHNDHGISAAHRYLFSCYMELGDWKRAEAAYSAIHVNDFHLHERPWKAAEIQRYRAQMALIRGKETTDLFKEAEQLAHKANDAMSIRAVEKLQGEAALRRGDGRAAARHFEAYQTLCQKARLDLREARGGLARALLRQGLVSKARDQLEAGADDLSAAEAWLGLFQRGQADAESKAEVAAHRAYKELWGEGAPYAHYNLPRAEAVLKALGVPIPVLPPYDESQRKRLPEEDRIIAFIEELEAKNAKKPDDHE